MATASTTTNQDDAFANLVMSETDLASALQEDGVLAKNLMVVIKEQIDLALGSDYTWVLGWVKDNIDPNDIYDDDQLEAWARDHGWKEAD
jgi:hypothetical protein